VLFDPDNEHVKGFAIN